MWHEEGGSSLPKNLRHETTQNVHLARLSSSNVSVFYPPYIESRKWFEGKEVHIPPTWNSGNAALLRAFARAKVVPTDTKYCFAKHPKSIVEENSSRILTFQDKFRSYLALPDNDADSYVAVKRGRGGLILPYPSQWVHKC